MRAICINLKQDNIKVNEVYLVKDNKGLTFINTNHVEIFDDKVLHLDKLEGLKAREIHVIVDAYVCSLLEEILEDSHVCRGIFFGFMFNNYGKQSNCIVINVNVVDPKCQVFDRLGNKMSEKLGLERRELDHAMAWFSTLGGAFSALGDNIEHCAVMAGKISEQQFKLALRLNDPLLLARCRLYLALSLIQQGYFRQAKLIIKSQYSFATSSAGICDQKLISMCHGIWAKWKYDKHKYKSQNQLKC